MKVKNRSELYRWFHCVLVWLIVAGLMVLIGEFLAAPFISWLFHDTPYQLPTWNRIERWAFGILFLGFFIGTITWYEATHCSGR